MGPSTLEAENSIGSANMQSVANNNLVLTILSSYKRLSGPEVRPSQTRLYQGICRTLIKSYHTEQVLEDLANRLASAADHSYILRRMDDVAVVGDLLSSFPLPREWQSAGRYYQALGLNRSDDAVRAGRMFEEVAATATPKYKARALLSLGTRYLRVGDPQTALSLYNEIRCIATRDFDPVTSYFAEQMTAVIKSLDGDHRGALADLEKMVPLVRMASSLQPYAYYDYLNSLAVELAETGRPDQARRAVDTALRSPYACAYPNWRETFEQVASKQQRPSRSVVAVERCTREVNTTHQRVIGMNSLVHLPRAESVAVTRKTLPGYSKARVLDFQKWKTMLEQSRRLVSRALTLDQRSQMTTGEKLIRLMDLISQDNNDDETIDSILEAVEQIINTRANQKPS